MPYIITTRTEHDPPKRAADGVTVAGVLRSRTAVATLDEAREAARASVKANRLSGHRVRFVADALLAAASLPEAGGTVGPLPDGTVIEVHPA